MGCNVERVFCLNLFAARGEEITALSLGWDVVFGADCCLHSLFLFFFRDHSRKTVLQKRRQLNVWNSLLACMLSDQKINILRNLTLPLGLYLPGSSLVLSLQALFGTSQTKAACKPQICEHLTHSRVPLIRGKLPLLGLESTDTGAEQG